MPINHDMMHAQTRPMFEKAGEVLEGVAKLKERVAELEADNKRLENAVDVYKSNANVFKCQVAEISMKLCESKKNYKAVCRALWLARAERYEMREFIAREEANMHNHIEWRLYLRKRTYDQWVVQLLRIANLANKLQNKCRAKAEEYK
ncbi:MAG: hypothetical protein J6U20_03965 [Fibrobacter sp.]|nr:hypothetical protein [Fibrobacter sp.]